MGYILLQESGTVVEAKVPFTFASGTLVLQAVVAGDILDTAWIRIDTVFDGPGATIELGTTTTPGLIFTSGNVDPFFVDQYTNAAFTEFPLNDFLQLVITPAGSTQGSGLLVYRYRR